MTLPRMGDFCRRFDNPDHRYARYSSGTTVTLRSLPVVVVSRSLVSGSRATSDLEWRCCNDGWLNSAPKHLARAPGPVCAARAQILRIARYSPTQKCRGDHPTHPLPSADPSGFSGAIDEVLAAMKAEARCCDVHAAWQAVLDQYGLKKKSRIGYSIGVGYAPDWGEHTISFRPDDRTVLPENAVVHIILGMWMDGAWS